MSVIESGGDLLANVVRFQLEVISDDCDGLYVGQPRCTAVLRRAAELGFKPVSPVFCQPRVFRSKPVRRTAWGCELEVLFSRPGVDVPAYLHHFHQPAMGGCTGTIGLAELKAANGSIARAANGSTVMTAPWVFKRFGTRKGGEVIRPGVEPYLCLDWKGTGGNWTNNTGY